MDEPLDLSAVKGEECLLVLCSDDEQEIRQFDETNYNLVVNEKEMGCRKLLFSPDDSVNAGNCIVWGVKDFVRYAGEATLAGILKRELSLTLAPPGDKAPGKPEQETEEVFFWHKYPSPPHQGEQTGCRTDIRGPRGRKTQIYASLGLPLHEQW